MQFSRRKLIFSLSDLDDVLKRKKFVTYANVNSFRILPESKLDFFFLADGWPVSIYSSFLTLKKVRRFSFFKLKDFWLDLSRSNSCAIVGYRGDELNKILQICENKNINFIFHSNGYRSTSELVKFIEEHSHKVDYLFLGTGQPKQEEIMKKLKHLEGKISIIACGAFWLQELGIKKEVTGLLTMLGLVSIRRFYKKPFELLKRTLLSLPFMFFYLKK